jgi:hypothetical protein
MKTVSARAALALFTLLAAVPALAQVAVLPPPTDTMENESPPPKPTLDWRATQVNRCADGKGGFVLRDTPCTTAPGDAASAAGDVAELTSLPPRPLPNALPAPAPETAGQGFFARGLLNGAWKLALLVLVGYFGVRLARALLGRIDDRRAAEESRRHGLGRVR